MAKCKWVNSKGVRCNKTAVEGRDGYCNKKHPKDNGGSASKGPKPGPSGGGSDVIGTAGGVARLMYYAARLWEIIQDHWPDILGFFNAEQLALCKKIASRKTEAARGKLLAELFSTLTLDQWLKLMAIMGAAEKSERGATTKRVKLRS